MFEISLPLTWYGTRTPCSLPAQGRCGSLRDAQCLLTVLLGEVREKGRVVTPGAPYPPMCSQWASEEDKGRGAGP